MGSGIYGITKVCFGPHMSWNSLCDQASSVLISVKTVVGNVPKPISGRFYAGVRFFTPLFFSLLLKRNDWRKGMEFQPECFFLFSQWCILRSTVYLLDFMLHRVMSIAFVKIVCCHNAVPPRMSGELTCGSF